MSTIRELMAQIDDWAGRKGWKANGEPPKAEHYALARIQWEECYQAAVRAEAVRELRNVLSRNSADRRRATSQSYEWKGSVATGGVSPSTTAWRD